MAATQEISVHVTPETKAHFRALADRQQLTQAALLKRLIHLSIQSVSAVAVDPVQPVRALPRNCRMALRLRSEDVVLLRERAAARQMKSATYASIFIRAHLRALAPLPKEELLALKHAVAELGAIGRNLNQIANSENATTAGPGRDDLRAILTLCEALRNHVKALIKTNLASWEIGHAQADD